MDGLIDKPDKDFPQQGAGKDNHQNRAKATNTPNSTTPEDLQELRGARTKNQFAGKPATFCKLEILRKSQQTTRKAKGHQNQRKTDIAIPKPREKGPSARYKNHQKAQHKQEPTAHTSRAQATSKPKKKTKHQTNGGTTHILGPGNVSAQERQHSKLKHLRWTSR